MAASQNLVERAFLYLMFIQMKKPLSMIGSFNDWQRKFTSTGWNAIINI